MNRKLIVIFLLVQTLLTSRIFSQNISINATGDLPDASAILDVSSNTKGILFPRMSTAEQNAISLPATGLIIFNTDLNTVQVNIGTPLSPVWSSLAATGSSVPISRTINTNAPLLGGGDLSINRTFSIDTSSSGGIATLYQNSLKQNQLNGTGFVKANGTTISYDNTAYSTYVFSGTASQYTKGNGTYATFPTNVSSFTNDAGYLTPSGTATVTNKTIAAGSNTITGLTNSNLSGSAGITNANLANSTISGVSLGSNLNALTLGYGLLGTSYNGSAAITAKVDTSTSNTNPATQGFVTRQATSGWNINGNTGTTSATNFLGTTDNKSLKFRTNNTQGLLLDSLGNIGIGTSPLFASGAPEKLLVDAGNTSSFNVISGKGTINNYLQLNIQNKSNGGNASSDVVATADNGDENNYYVDMGINSSGNTSGFGAPDDAYLYNLGGNFLVGTGSAKAFILNTSATERMRIDASGNVGINNLTPSEKLDVTGNIKFSGALMPNNLSGAAGTFLKSNGAGVAPTWTVFDTTSIASFSTKVRSLFSATAPVTYSNGLIGITQANASTNGYLSSTDWNTFNSKGNGSVTSISITSANGVSGTVATSTTTPAITLSLGAITPTSVAATGAVTGSNLSGTNTGDQTITLTSDVTGTGTGSFATTIGANKVTYAKIQQVAGSNLLGNPTGSAANASEIPLGSGLSFVSGALTANTQTATGTAGGDLTGTYPNPTIAALAVTNAKLAGSITASKLIGTDIATVGTITTGTWHGSPIADAYISSAASWNAKQNAITTGTTAQYLRGDLSLATFPTNVSAFTNDARYWDSVRAKAWANATFQPIGSYSTYVFTGTTSQYTRGDGTYATFPTNVSSFTNDANYLTPAGAATVTNKTIAAGSNTITGLTNSNLSGSAGISNANLANSTISGVALGSNLNALTLGYGLLGTSYNGSGAVTAKVDTSTSNTNPATQGFVTRQATSGWNINGNSGTTSSNFLGTTDNHSLKFRTNNTQRMVIDSSTGNMAIGQNTFDATNPEKFIVNAGTTSSVNAIVATGSIDSYLQMNIKNTSAGNNATSDIVATADNGTETTNYVDFGINGSNYTGGAIQTGVANDGYLISAGNDFYMVNSSANKSMLFLTGGTGVANERMRILANGRVGMGVQDPTAPFVVKDTMEIRRVGPLSQLLFTNTAGSGDFRIGGDGGDLFWQGGGSRNLQMGSYWTTILTGDRQTASYPAFVSSSGGTGVLVLGQRNASVPLGVQAYSGSQTANLTEWRNSSGTVLDAVTKDGNLGLGTSSPTSKLQVVGTDPLTLNGVQLGTNTSTDSILTITGGVVKKLPASTFSTGSPSGAAGGDLTGTYPNPTIANSAVTNAKLANMAANTFKANNTGSAAAPSDINATQATAMLNNFTSTTKGLAPLSGGGTSNFLRADGTWAVPASASGLWSLTGNTGTTSATNFLGTTDNKSLKFRTNNTQGLLLDSLGNIGIGTSPLFASGAPEKLLVDAGNTSSFNVISGKGTINNYLQLNIQNKSNGGNASSDVVATADNGDENNYYVDMGINSSGNTSGFGAPDDAYLYNLGGNFLVGTGSAKAFILNTSATERMRIDASGNVGINNLTPSEKLDVTGNIKFSGALMPGGDAGSSGEILVSAGSNTSPNWVSSSTYFSANSWILGGNNVTSLQKFGTTSNYDLPFITNNTEKMRLSAGGNLGIGATVKDTTNAEKLLVDAGSTSYNVISGKGNNTGYLQLNIKNSNTGTTASSDVVATNDAGTEANQQYFIDMGINSSGYSNTGILGGAGNAYLYTTGNDFIIGNSAANKPLRFYTTNNTTSTEAMRINEDGEVGIANTNPTSTMDVNGSMAHAITTTAANITLGDNNYTVIITGGTPTVTLPAAATYNRRVYIIVNTTGAGRTISTYKDFTNTSNTTIPANTSIMIQSNGTNWYRIQ